MGVSHITKLHEMSREEFADLVEELKSGNNRMLKSIFEMHASYCIDKLVFKYKSSREDAEDIYVDSVLNLREKIVAGKIEAIGDLKSYLFATCKNMLFVRIKKEQRVNDAVAVTYGYANTVENDDSNQLEEMLRLTEESLSAIPIKCQEILKAFYFDKLSLEEIAVKFNFASANVAKVSKARCFQKLVEQVKSYQRKENVIG